MDPNEALRMIRQQVAAHRAYEQQTKPAPRAELVYALDVLTGHVEALDEWLSRGGFLPDAWSRLASLRRERTQDEVSPCTELSGAEEDSGWPVASGLDAL